MTLISTPIAISHDKLRRLRPGFYGVRGSLRAMAIKLGLGTSVRAIIEDSFRNGSRHAAVVVSVRPLLVAAYSEMYGCVAMLRFPNWLADENQLSVCDRLLTINSYVKGNDDNEDLKLVRSSQDSKLRFQPLIADFLSENREAIEETKSTISEVEWLRTEELALEYLLQRPAFIRDGRPGRSMIPAPTEMPKIWVIAFMFVLLIGSVIGEFGAVPVFVAACQVSSWPITTGVIRQSFVEPDRFSNSKFYARVIYDYVVDGKNYSSSGIRRIEEKSNSRWDMDRLVAQFPPQSEVQVYYDQTNPSKSYLNPRILFVDYVVVIGPVVFGSLLVIALYELTRIRIRMVAGRRRAWLLATQFANKMGAERVPSFINSREGLDFL